MSKTQLFDKLPWYAILKDTIFTDLLIRKFEIKGAVGVMIKLYILCIHMLSIVPKCLIYNTAT